VIELGSGFGYSGYWHSRAVGPTGELHLTDGDPENERKAMDYLGRAGLADPVRFHVGDAVTSMQALEGDFDLVYCDIDKHGYPAAWRASRDRIRVGGMYVCDNVLWSGRVTGAVPDDQRPTWTQAILEHNAEIADDPRYVSSIVPTRDGVMVALRTS
jgi:predicted O-methyltransferase YrrM